MCCVSKFVVVSSVFEFKRILNSFIVFYHQRVNSDVNSERTV